MAKLYNLARMSTATAGTGIITLGSPISGFLSFAAAGVADGETVSYGISDGANSEKSEGVYTASGTTLTRVVKTSTNSNTAINLSGTAQVFITPGKEDLGNLKEPNTWQAAQTFSAAITYGGVTLSNAVTGTGNMVLSASPTLTGTVSAAAIAASGAISTSDTTPSTSTTTGSGKVAGGFGVAGQVSAGNLALFPASGGALMDISGMTAIGTAAALPSQHTAVNAPTGNVLLHVWETGVNVLYAQFAMANGSIALIYGDATKWDALGASAASGKSSIVYNAGNINIVNNVNTAARYKVQVVKA